MALGLRQSGRFTAHRITRFGWGFQALALGLMTAMAPARAAKPYEPPLVLEKQYVTVQVAADGSYVNESEIQLKVATPQGIQSAGSRNIEFVASQDEVLSVEAWSISPSGVRQQVPESAIRTQEEQGDDSGIQFSDTRYKVIIFPNLEVGSRIHYKSRVRHRVPNYPGQFDEGYHFPGSMQWLDARFDYFFPASMKVYLDTKGIEGGLTDTVGGMQHYQFRYRNESVVPPQRDRVSLSDYADHLRISTFPDPVALGVAFHDNYKPKARMTEEIRAQSLRLTDPAMDEVTKVRKLYEWVAMNIRYVSVSLGDGRLVPHEADEVLKNRYGDCKDHVVLLDALLQAVGIESSPALISSGIAYKLSSIGVIAPLNHVITYLPTLDLYLDSTDQFAPFRQLPLSDLDKPTVLTALGRMGRTPKAEASINVSRTTVKLRIDEEGLVHGTAAHFPRGLAEISARGNRFYNRTTPEADLVKDLLQRFNETGTGSMEYPDPEKIDQPFSVQSQFQLNPIANIPGRGAITIPVGLAPGSIAWLGADEPLEKKFDYPCVSRSFFETYSIEFPGNVTLDGVPSGTQFENRIVRYSSTFAAQGQVVEIARKVEINYPGSVCGPVETALWKSFHRVLQRDLRSQIFYH